MIPTWDEIASKEPGRPAAETVRQHVLEGILRRLARLPHAENFILRGGVLMRWWAKPVLRPAQDLDLVGNFPFGVDETLQRFQPIVHDREVHDGVSFVASSYRGQGIWLASAFPGVRLFLKACFEEASWNLQFDIGFNDPLIPNIEQREYPLLHGGETASIWCVAMETALAWKFHGLAERGPRQWRAKDLHDLFLLCQMPLRDEFLPAALDAAFTSRGYNGNQAREVLESPTWWTSKLSKVKWIEFCQTGLEVPPDLSFVVAAVQQRLHTVVCAL